MFWYSKKDLDYPILPFCCAINRPLAQSRKTMITHRVGQFLGNYRLTRLLGQGGFADVYLGEHVHLNTEAAIKVLRTQLTSQDVASFRNEARLIAHLEHPHVVQILDFG